MSRLIRRPRRILRVLRIALLSRPSLVIAAMRQRWRVPALRRLLRVSTWLWRISALGWLVLISTWWSRRRLRHGFSLARRLARSGSIRRPAPGMRGLVWPLATPGRGRCPVLDRGRPTPTTIYQDHEIRCRRSAARDDPGGGGSTDDLVRPEIVEITRLDRLDGLSSLFDQVLHQGPVGLPGIPRTTPPQGRHDTDQTRQLRVGH